MAEISTVHETDRTTIRRVTVDGEDYDFFVDDSEEVPTHDFRGDGEAPEEATDALREWVFENHDGHVDEQKDHVDHDVDEADQDDSANE